VKSDHFFISLIGLRFGDTAECKQRGGALRERFTTLPGHFGSDPQASVRV
jgi:hypothetical protein